MRILIIMLLISSINSAKAQTEMDGIMMDKKFFCAGALVGTSNWNQYWEGTLKRENLNLGTVKTKSAMIMGNYGISNKFNIIFGLPYIATSATAGQLMGQQGVQDLSLWAKYVVHKHQTKIGTFQGILVGGVSTPVSKYTPDLLPLSIGMQSKTANAKLIVDWQKKNWTATASGTYVYRGNVSLDRNTYYTTTMHYTNQVAMPNATNINLRAGYRSEAWIAELIYNNWITNGGFDITRNNMPFVSNKMNAKTIGAHVKYETPFVDGLSIVLDGSTTLKGRNVGQANAIQFGAFYIMDWNKKMKTTTAAAQ